jgi:hypothetical protein
MKSINIKSLKQPKKDVFRLQITKEIFVQGSPAKCYLCHETKSDKADLESIYETGMCLGCDHVYGECLEDRLLEMREEIGIHYNENN